MADELTSIIGKIDVGGAVSGITTAVIYILILLAIIGIMWFIFYWLSFKFPVTIRDIANNRQIIGKDLAKRIKDRNGVYWWKLRRLREKIPEPPSECIDVNKKGKKSLELFRADDGSFIPIEVKFNYTEWKKTQLLNKATESFKPFGSNQRTMYVHELRESETYKKKKLSDTLMAIAPYIAIVLILVIFMIFFGETVKPTVALSEQVAANCNKCYDSLGQCTGIILHDQNNNNITNKPAPN
jgi:hypothetical protein